MLRHLKHANATPAAMERASKFECPQCDSKSKPVPTRKTAPDIDQPPLKSIGMDVKELPGWQPHQRVKALNIVCDTSSLQSMTPFETDDTECAMDLLRLYRDNWTRPYMRPRWMKVDPARAFISDQFEQAMNRDGTEILDSAGMAHEQNGKVERHGQWFEMLLQGILTEVQPTTESEWRECVAQLQEAKNSLPSVGGTSPCQIIFGRNPEVPRISCPTIPT